MSVFFYSKGKVVICYNDNMSVQHLQVGFFFIFILGILWLNYFIFLPYLSVLFLALVFAIIFDPLYEKILKTFRGRSSLAALVTVFLVLMIIVGPISFFGTLLFQEASNLYTSAISETGPISSSQHVFNTVGIYIEKLFPGFSISQAEFDFTLYTKQGLSWLINHTSIFFRGFVKIAFGLFLMLLALFYFFRDGKKFIDSLIDLSPLSDSSDKKLVERVVIAINSVVRGYIVIGIVQGFMTGIGLALFGVPNAVIWGFVAAIASFIPTIGTSLVLIPGILFLFISGSAAQATGLILWGTVAVGLIDNLLGPMLIERGVKIHPFLILISALGGLSYLGPVGFLAGPVLLSLLFALLDLYPSMIRKELSKKA